MADIRIKDLTTTASSTASDDFIAVDGTTNGTRKLNAFSPTFGGNATVTGTLTVNSTSSFAGTATIAVGNGVAATIGLNQTGVANAYLTQKATSGDLALGNGGGDQLTIAKATGVVSIASTSSSTSTSSGALVVGNGTSGGLGVGGSINTGGTLRFHTNTNLPGVGSIGISSTFGLNMYASTGSSYDFAVFNAAGNSLILNPTGTLNITLPGQLSVNSATSTFGTSASSGTSLKVISGVGTLAAPKYSTLDFRNYNDLKTGAYIRTGNRESDTNEWLLEIAARSNADVLTSVATFGSEGTSFGASPSTTGAVVSATGTGTSGATRIIAHLENNFATAALNNAAQLRFKVFNNSVGDGEIAAINGISDSVTPGARTTALSFLTGQQTVGVVERMRISGTGTVSLSGGLLTISKSGAGSTLEVNADSGYDSKISLQRAATNRWTIECDSSDTLRFKSLGSTQIVAVTSSNLTFSGDLLFFANSTYDIGTTANRVRQIFVRDIYSTFYTPASATDTGTAGRICYDSNYIYICTATNTWKRAAISTW